MRYLFGFMCVSALGVVPLVGCSENKQQEPDLEWPPNATAYFDGYGILSADCATDEDCAMVLGYYHAADRFVQMDLLRRLARGKLTEVLDKSVAEFFDVAGVDASNRALFSTRDGKPVEDVFVANATEETLTMLKAYSAGVNQWIADVRDGKNSAVFPRQFGPPFAYGPADVPEWTPEDSMAAVLLLIDTLTRQTAHDVNAGIAREAIGDDDKFFDVWNRRRLVDSSILAPGWQPPTADAAANRSSAKDGAGVFWRDELNAEPALRRLSIQDERNAEFRRWLFGDGAGDSATGSNSWVVGPSRSASGNALLANDIHLALSQPAVWYVAHLDAKTNGSGKIHSAGFTVPALPWVISGQNESIAWGPTNTSLDFTDWYIEELVTDSDGNPTGVMFEGNAVPLTRVPFTVTFVDGETEERELLFVPHHGPMVTIDVENHVAISLRWTLQETLTDPNIFPPLARAQTVEEARVADESGTVWGSCLVVADGEGTIGYFPYNKPPKRTWATGLSGDAPPWLPLDGRCETPDRCYEWTEFWNYTELPQVVNPAEGFIATANNDITGALADGDPTNDGYPPLQTDARPGLRHARIVELINEIGSEHTTETMHRIQSDAHSLIGELMTPGLIAIAESEMASLSERAQRVLDSLKAWQFTCPTGIDGPNQDAPLTGDADQLREAVGCSAFHAALYRCRDHVLRNEHAVRSSATGLEPISAFFFSVVDPTQLRAGDVYWDDPATPQTETKYEVLESCFDEAGRVLETDLGLGADPTKWAWGPRHGPAADLRPFRVRHNEIRQSTSRRSALGQCRRVRKRGPDESRSRD